MNIIRVGISEYKITNAPNKLITLGLGSCVGIAIYQKDTMIGGLSHILLPDSKAFADLSKPQKFADLAIPMMISDIVRRSKSDDLVAKIVGGASMFSSNINKMDGIGKRNVDSVISTLDKCKIPIIASHVGGSKSRTMTFDLETFEIQIVLDGTRNITI